MLELYLPVGPDTSSCAPPDPCPDCSRRSQLMGSLAANNSLSASLTNTSADALLKMSSHSPHIDTRHLLTCIAHGCLEPLPQAELRKATLSFASRIFCTHSSACFCTSASGCIISRIASSFPLKSARAPHSLGALEPLCSKLIAT